MYVRNQFVPYTFNKSIFLTVYLYWLNNNNEKLIAAYLFSVLEWGARNCVGALKKICALRTQKKSLAPRPTQYPVYAPGRNLYMHT